MLLESRAAALFVEAIKWKLIASIPGPWLQTQAPTSWVVSETLVLSNRVAISHMECNFIKIRLYENEFFDGTSHVSLTWQLPYQMAEII